MLDCSWLEPQSIAPFLSPLVFACSPLRTCKRLYYKRITTPTHWAVHVAYLIMHIHSPRKPNNCRKRAQSRIWRQDRSRTDAFRASATLLRLVKHVSQKRSRLRERHRHGNMRVTCSQVTSGRRQLRDPAPKGAHGACSPSSSLHVQRHFVPLFRSHRSWILRPCNVQCYAIWRTFRKPCLITRRVASVVALHTPLPRVSDVCL